MPRKLRPDMWLFGAVVLLLSAGVVMVYSASAIVAADRFQDPYLFLKKQLVWALLGAGCLLVALRVDYRRLERLGWPILLAAGVLLVLVLVPPLAQPINGTRRWLRLGPVSFQPAELAKLALVIYLAGYLTQKRAEIDDFRRGLLQPLAVAAALAVLILVQPDLGNCLTLVAVTFALLYLAGSPGRYLGFIVGAALAFVAPAIRRPARPLRRLPGARHHRADCDPDARQSRRGDRGAADQGVALAVHLVRRLGPARHDGEHGRPPQHLPARPCLNAISRSTSSASAAAGCRASPRSWPTWATG